MEKYFRHIFQVLICTLVSTLLFNEWCLAQDYNSWQKIDSKGMNSAYVRAIALDKNDTNNVYIGLKGGGVYHLEDSVWTEMNTGLSCKDVLSLAIHPNESDTIYAGTEKGIFKSIKNGDVPVWEKLNFPECHVNSIAIYPKNPNTVYAAVGKLYGKGETIKGLWYSEDSGESWNQIVLEDHGLPVEVYSVFAHELESGAVYVYVGTSNGIWIDTDNSFNFRYHVNNLWTERVYCFAVNPNNDGSIYAGTQRGLRLGSNYDAFENEAWTHTDSTLTNRRITCITTDSNSIYAGTFNDGLFKSDLFSSIGSANWNHIYNGNEIIYSTTKIVDFPLITYLGTERGFFESRRTNLFDNELFETEIDGISCAQMNEFIIDPDYNIYAATQSGLFKKDKDSTNWEKEIIKEKIKNEEVITIAIDKNNPDALYASISDNGVYEFNENTWNLVTTKETYSILSDGDLLLLGGKNNIINRNEDEICSPDHPVIVIKKDNNDSYYAGTKSGGIFRFGINGERCKNISNSVLSFSTINAILISKSNKIICGTEQGVYSSSTDNINWQKVNDSVTEYLEITDLISHPNNKNIILASTKRAGVFLSIDGGNSFRAFNNNLDNLNILCLEKTNVQNDLIFYAGTEGNSIYHTKLGFPFVTSNPESILFDDTKIQEIDTGSFVIYNSGNENLIITSVGSNNTAFGIVQNQFPVTIAPKDSHEFYLTFEPTHPILYSGEITITSNDPQQPEFRIPVTGKGIAPFILLENELHFGKVRVNDSGTLLLKIKNTGGDTLNIANITTTQSISVFSVIQGENLEILPKDTFSINIIFTPNNTTSFKDSLTIEIDSNVAGETYALLTGTGIAPLIQIDKDTIDFGLVKIPNSAEKTFIIKNTGEDVLTISKMKFTEEDGVYEIHPDSGQIAPKGSLSVKIAFAPQERQNYPNTLNIYSDSFDGEDFEDTTSIEILGKGIAPKISLDKNAIKFDPTAVGSSKNDSIAIFNTGNDTLKVNFCVKPTHFSIDSTDTNIAPGDTFFLIVEFNPDAQLFYEDILTICCDDPDNPRVVVSLEGQGIAPEVELENKHNFGNIRISDSSDWTFKIKNNGDDTLKIRNIYVLEYNNVYTITPYSGEVLPDSTLFITIIFQPDTSGEYPDTLIIKSNKFRGNNIVLLYGRGIRPEIATPNSTIDFDIVPIDECKSKNVVLYNLGDHEVNIHGVILTYNSDIYKADKIAFKIAAKETTEVKITFCPTHEESYTDTLIIHSDAINNQKLKIELTGAGSGDDDPPEISHEPLSIVPKCSETTISATIQDNVSGVARASVYFRMGSEPAFHELEMSESNNDKYEAKIPSNCVTTRGVEYYLFAEDSLGNHCRVPANSYYSIQVRVEGRGEVKTDSSWIYQTLHSGDTKNSYRLFSIPLELDNPNIDSLLSKNLGLKLLHWRIFDYDSGGFVECPDTSKFRPGKSYWLIVKKQGQVIYTGTGQSVKTSKEEPFEIPIDTSWTTFANPYNFKIPVEKLSIDGAVSKLNICTYQGRWVCGNEIEYLEPWEGYLIKHHQAANLSIPSDLTGYEKTPSNTQPNGWSIQIIAKCLNSIDSYNYIGVRNEASDGWDQFDLYEPPIVGEYISVFLPHSKWNQKSGNYTTDFHAPFLEGDFWDFEVATNIQNSPIQLEFIFSDSIFKDYDIYLIDPKIKSTYNLKNNNYYTYQSLSAIVSKRLRIAVGSKNFIEKSSFQISLEPDNYQLKQNFPNPFNHITSISYSLPKASRVTIKIYNIVGELIRILKNNELQSSGYYNIDWNGLNNYNIQVSTGVYFCYFKASDFQKYIKMVYLR